MVFTLHFALKQFETQSSTSFASFFHTSTCLSNRSGFRYQSKPKRGGRGGKIDGSRSRKPPSGPSRKRLETFSKSRPASSHIRNQRIITTPKNFGLRSDSPYQAAEEEAREVSSQDISKKQLARKQHTEENHRHYEQALSYQAFMERRGRRLERPSGPERHLPRSKVGELTVTHRPSDYNTENLPQSFASPPLTPALLQGVREVLGSNRPSPIQALSLKYLFPPGQNSKLKRKDVHGYNEHLLASETGTGKTIAYLLPLLQHLKLTENFERSAGNIHSPRALVLAPTHELTRQLSKVAKNLVHAQGAKLRLLCSSVKNNPSTGVAKDSINVTARRMKMLVDQEFEIMRDAIGKKQHPVDVIFSTPMKALEMVKGRGWDRELRDEEKALRSEVGEWIEGSEEQASAGSTNARERRGKLPEARIENSERQNKSVKEMNLRDVEWVVVDEADVLFDPDFRQYTELLLSEIAAARGFPVPVSYLEVSKADNSSEKPESKAMLATSYPFHLTLTSATIPLSLSAYLSDRHPRMTYLTSPNLHKLPRKLKVEHVNWSSGNHNADVEAKVRSIWAGNDGTTGDKILIFTNKNSKVEELGEWLTQKGVKNVAMTSQSSIREYGSNKHIAGFLNVPAHHSVKKPSTSEDLSLVTAPASTNKPNDEPKVLITTSLLSRGLDFSPSIANVFILDSPRNVVDFLHRAGRTARAGRAGRVILFQKESGRGSASSKRMKDKVRKLF